MPYILNIHTATETAIVNLCSGKDVIDSNVNFDPKQHASFLHTAIRTMLKKQNIEAKQLNAIGVSCGPGSYTGIRVGLAAAKGLCYALNIPLITYNSLELIARSTLLLVKDSTSLYCAMIDARRLEVYTAVYDGYVNQISAPEAIILDENSFSNMLSSNVIIFSGSGSHKFREVTKNANAKFSNAGISMEAIAQISWQKFENNEFENISTMKPVYIKDFHTSEKK
jgi:tRNA threonylcarbamoyladenosine biosynthesis protein TsaB